MVKCDNQCGGIFKTAMNILWPLNEERSTSYRIILGIWAIVAAYAILHDQYIVQIAPEHFTEYHPAIWEIENPRILAAVHAFLASFSPGLLLGVACLFAARAGLLPKVSVRYVLVGVVYLVILTEIFSLMMGYYVHLTGQPLYPKWCYPDFSRPMLVTQTIQLSCYGVSALLSGLFLLKVTYMRFSRLPHPLK